MEQPNNPYQGNISGTASGPGSPLSPNALYDMQPPPYASAPTPPTTQWQGYGVTTSNSMSTNSISSHDSLSTSFVSENFETPTPTEQRFQNKETFTHVPPGWHGHQVSPVNSHYVNQHMIGNPMMYAHTVHGNPTMYAAPPMVHPHMYSYPAMQGNTQLSGQPTPLSFTNFISKPNAVNAESQLKQKLEQIGQQILTFNPNARIVIQAFNSANLLNLFGCIKDTANNDKITPADFLLLRPKKNAQGLPVSDNVSKILGFQNVPQIMSRLCQAEDQGKLLIILVMMQDLVCKELNIANPNQSLAVAVGMFCNQNGVNFDNHQTLLAFNSIAQAFDFTLVTTGNVDIQTFNKALSDNLVVFNQVKIDDASSVVDRFMQHIPFNGFSQQEISEIKTKLSSTKHVAALLMEAQRLAMLLESKGIASSSRVFLEMMRAILTAPDMEQSDFFAEPLSPEERTQLNSTMAPIEREKAAKTAFKHWLSTIQNPEERLACQKIAVLEFDMLLDDMNIAQPSSASSLCAPHQQILPTSPPNQLTGQKAVQLLKKHRQTIMRNLTFCVDSIATLHFQEKLLSRDSLDRINTKRFPSKNSEQRATLLLTKVENKMRSESSRSAAITLHNFIESLCQHIPSNLHDKIKKQISLELDNGKDSVQILQQYFNKFHNLIAQEFVLNSFADTLYAKSVIPDEELNEVKDPDYEQLQFQKNLLLDELELKIAEDPKNLQKLIQAHTFSRSGLKIITEVISKEAVKLTQ